MGDPGALVAALALAGVYALGGQFRGAAAMAFHFLVIEHALRGEHGRAYDRVGRWILAGGVLAGWLVGVTTHVSEAFVSRLFAVVVGGVVITSMKAELPRDGEGRFGPFCLGAAAYAFLLLAA